MADWDALFLSAALRDSDRTAFRGLRPEHMDGAWGDALLYVREFAQKYTELPSVQVFLDEHPALELPVPDAPAAYYRDQILRRAQCAMLTERLGEVAESLEEAKAEAALYQLKAMVADAYREFQVGATTQAIDYAEHATERIESYKKRKEEDGVIGIPTPWPTVTEVTSGWQATDFIVFVAKSGVGKTFLGAKAAVDAMLKGYNVLFCSQEMSPEQISFRFDGIVAQLNTKSISSAVLLEDEEKHYFDCLLALSDENSGYGRMNVLGPGDVASILDVDAAIDLYQPDLVVWDSFYAVTSTKHEDQSNLAADIKRLAGRRGLPLIGISQLNAMAEEGSGAATQNAMAFTKRIFKEADFVLAIWQTKEMQAQKEMTGKSLKVRKGEPIEKIVLHWDHNNSNFDEKIGGASSGGTTSIMLNDEIPMEFFKKSKRKPKSSEAIEDELAGIDFDDLEPFEEDDLEDGDDDDGEDNK